MTRDPILSILDRLQGQCRIGITSGCFDLLHYYHVRYLERCREACDLLIVGVDSDRLVQKHKLLPVIHEHHRVAMVAALRCVNVAFLMHSTAFLHEATRRCDVLFKNAPVVYGHEIAAHCPIEIIPDVQELYSTGEIRRAVLSRSPEETPIDEPRAEVARHDDS